MTNGETHEQHGERLERQQMSAIDVFLDALVAYHDARDEGRKGDARRHLAEMRRGLGSVVEVLTNQVDHRTAHMLVSLWKDLAETQSGTQRITGIVEALREDMERLHLHDTPQDDVTI